MGSIEERIEVTGADESKRKLDEVAGAQQRVGAVVDESGRQADKSKGSFLNLGGVLAGAATAATGFISSFAGLAAIVSRVREFIQLLERARQIQQELADKALTLAESAQLVSAQTGISEGEAVRRITEVRKAGGVGLGVAVSLINASDVALQNAKRGGVFEGDNFDRVREIAPFVGAKRFGSDESSALVSSLAVFGGFDEGGDTKSSLAKIVAAALASRETDLGQFLIQFSKGGERLGQQDVSLEGALEFAVQARGAEANANLAAESMKAVTSLALGVEERFDTEIRDRARREGLDADALSTTQRLRLTRDIFSEADTPAERDRLLGIVSGDRAFRAFAVFGQENLDRSSGAVGKISAADAGAFDEVVSEGRKKLPFIRNVNAAKIDADEYIEGLARFMLSEAINVGESKMKILRSRVAAGEARLPRAVRGEVANPVEDEALREFFALRFLAEAINASAPEGDAPFVIGKDGRVSLRTKPGSVQFDDTILPPEIEDQFKRFGAFQKISPSTGVPDAALSRFANFTANFINTQYNAPDPLTDPPPVVDANQ